MTPARASVIVAVVTAMGGLMVALVQFWPKAPTPAPLHKDPYLGAVLKAIDDRDAGQDSDIDTNRNDITRLRERTSKIEGVIGE